MKETKLKVEYKSVDKLIPYVNNARTHDEKQVTQIAASIKEFGFNNPILMDGDNGVVAGHGRLMAAKKLGLKEVPCIELSHLSEVQKKAYILADNKLALNAGWDDEMLKNELESLKAMDFDLSLAGFEDDDTSESSNENNQSEVFETFQILIDCDSENQQQLIFEELTEKGYKCRVQSL